MRKISTQKRVRSKKHKKHSYTHRAGGLFNTKTKNLHKNVHYYEDTNDLYQSIDDGNIALATELLTKKGVNPNIKKYGFAYSPLEYAIEKKQDDIAKLLIKKGAFKKGAIEVALKSNPDIVDYLIKEGALPKYDTIQKVKDYKKYKETIGAYSGKLLLEKLSKEWFCTLPEEEWRNVPFVETLLRCKLLTFDRTIRKLKEAMETQPEAEEGPKNSCNCKTSKPTKQSSVQINTNAPTPSPTTPTLFDPRGTSKGGRVLHAIGRFKTPRRTRKNNNLHKLDRQMRVTHYSI
jgi:hypothetical protein